MTTMNDLKNIAAQLNKATDEINLTLQQTEEELRKLNLGVEAMTEDWIYASNVQRDEASNSAVLIKTHLGFQKLDGHWRIVARNYLASPDLDATAAESERYDLQEIIPICNAARPIRATAVGNLNLLLDLLKKGSETLLLAIGRAHTTVA